jgi:Tfp pilus assembly protein PilO
MKINLKNLKPFLLPALIIFLILVVTVFVLKPRVEVMTKSRQQLTKDKKILADLTKKLATLEGLAKVEFSEKTDIALAVLPAEKDVPSNLAVIKNVALNNGLIVNDITISEVGEIATVSSESKLKKDAILPSFKLNVSLTGSMEMIKNFISQIQSTAPLMEVKNVSLSQKKTESPETKMEIEAYFLPFPKTLGKPEQQLIAITSGEEKIFSRINDFTFLKGQQILPNLPVGKENLFSP